MGTIITFSILFDFDDDKNGSSFWTNNEKAGNCVITIPFYFMCEKDTSAQYMLQCCINAC